MNRARPPGNGKGALAGAYPENTDANDAGQRVNDFTVFRNHRIVAVRRALPKEEWAWLRQAATTARFLAEWETTL
jgi:hypothetical protein